MNTIIGAAAACLFAIAVWNFFFSSPFGSGNIDAWISGAGTLSEKVENFDLLDQNGDAHELFYYSDADAIVLISHGVACPIVRQSAAEIMRLKEKFTQKRDVVFLMLNANPQDDRQSILKEAAEYGLEIPILKDDTQLIAESLHLTRTAEAIVILPENGEVLYRGPIDNRLGYETQRVSGIQHYLEDYLISFLNGDRPPRVRMSGLKGCLISMPDTRKQASPVSYAETIVPVLKEKCMLCHRAGGVGPWAMTDYQTVKGWAPMMREVIRTKRMPPWGADNSEEFNNDRSLSVEEERALVHWIESGAPKETANDPLVDAHSGLQQTLAEPALNEAPDIIIQVQKQEIPAAGIVPYRYPLTDFRSSEDLWVRRMEIVTETPRALHHALVYPKGFKLDEDTYYGAYVPGMRQLPFPDGTGRFIPKGSRLTIQLHYTPTGKAETDNPSVNLYLHPSKPKWEFLMKGAFNTKLKIPARQAKVVVKADFTFERDSVIYSVAPHMHYRGRSMRYELRYPDGEEKLLISVPRYNFNWQTEYRLKQPKPVPAGTKLLCTGVFDNSARNTRNPDPNRTVLWGDQSEDEMIGCYVSFIEAPDGEIPSEAGQNSK